MALWQSINPVRETTQNQQVADTSQSANTQTNKIEGNQGKQPEETQAKKQDGKEGKNAEATNGKTSDTSLVKKPADEGVKKVDSTDIKKTEDTESEAGNRSRRRKAKPSAERVDVGSYYFDPKSPPSVLVQRRREEEDGIVSNRERAWPPATVWSACPVTPARSGSIAGCTCSYAATSASSLCSPRWTICKKAPWCCTSPRTWTPI